MLYCTIEGLLGGWISCVVFDHSKKREISLTHYFILDASNRQNYLRDKEVEHVRKLILLERRHIDGVTA